jgi:hypothetical protein
VTEELESGYDETKIHTQFKDLSHPACDGSGCGGGAGSARPQPGGERAAVMDAETGGNTCRGVFWKRPDAVRPRPDRGLEEIGRPDQGRA